MVLLLLLSLAPHLRRHSQNLGSHKANFKMVCGIYCEPHRVFEKMLDLYIYRIECVAIRTPPCTLRVGITHKFLQDCHRKRVNEFVVEFFAAIGKWTDSRKKRDVCGTEGRVVKYIRIGI